MLVKFYFHPVKSGIGEDGLDLYKDQVYIVINRDMTHTVNRKANADDIKRFRELHDAFLKATEGYEKLEGLPLEMWAAVTPAMVHTLKVRDIRTVQDLASIPREVMDAMPSEYKNLTNRARKFIDIASASSSAIDDIQKLTEERDLIKADLKEAREEAALLRNQLKEKAA